MTQPWAPITIASVVERGITGLLTPNPHRVPRGKLICPGELERAVADDFRAPADPEIPRDCKGVLTRARAAGHPYKETVDQAALASVFDLEMARAGSPSFAKFCRDVGALLGIAGG